MNKNQLAAFVACIAVAAIIIGCTTTTNTNTNGNTAVVTNTNRNANVVNTNIATANANTSAINANISREEYERDRARFEREAREAGRKVGTGANDLWLWTKTRAALATTDDLRDSTVDVDVENDRVTLSGTVANAAQKTKAEQVARGIDGIKSVKNQLRVSARGDNTNQNTNRNGNANRNVNTRS